MSIQKYILLPILICFLFQVQAQENIIQITEFKEQIKLPLDKIQVLEELGKELSIKEVLSKQYQDDFANYVDAQKALKPFRVYWLKLEFDNQLLQDTDWIFFLGYVTQAKVFVQTYQKRIKANRFAEKKTGIFMPTSDKDIRAGEDNKVHLRLPQRQKTIVYVRFKNEIAYPPELNLYLQTEHSWTLSLANTNLWQGLFQGLLIMMMLHNLFLFIGIKDRTYLYYILYIFIVSLHFARHYEYLNQSLIGEFPEFSFHLSNAIYVGLIFYFQFMRSFLNTANRVPKWDAVMQIWVVACVAFAVILPVFSIFNFELYLSIRNIFHVLYLFMISFFLVVVGFVGDKMGKYFIYGTIFMIVGGFLVVLGNFNIIPFNLYYLLGGIATQLITFSFGLSARFKLLMDEKENMQNQLILQYKRNEMMQDKARRELEQKVRERTQELAQQKEEIETQRDKLEEKSEEIAHAYKGIQDSVRYAQKIQNAILGNPKLITDNFEDAFIMLLPQNIVSGDFYWFAKVPHLFSFRDDYELKILIGADCTGHGIPGAFMTVMANSLLNEVINEGKITDPHQILYELDKRIVSTLQSRRSDKDSKRNDGMDVVILLIDERANKIVYGGAKNPLWYVRNGEMNVIKASKFPVGSTQFRKKKTFESHTIEVQKGDKFYILSDGFQDQLGEVEKRKYLTKRLRNYVLSISHLPMQAQKEKLLEEFYTWQGNVKQTDDVLVMGFEY